MKKSLFTVALVALVVIAGFILFDATDPIGMIRRMHGGE